MVVEEWMKRKHLNNIWILILQWSAFGVAVVAFLFFILFHLKMTDLSPKFVLPILVAFYGIIIGILGIIKQKEEDEGSLISKEYKKKVLDDRLCNAKKSICFFYLMISVCILVIVGFVAYKL